MKNWRIAAFLFVVFAIRLTLSIIPSAGACIQPPSGLVSWWTGDGNGADIIGPNAAAPQNGVTFTSGMVDQAFSFDGSDDYMLASDTNIRDLQQLTVSLWVKHHSLPSGKIMRYVTFLGETVILRYDGNSGTRQLHFAMTIYGAFRHVRVDNVLQVGVLHHVAATYDGKVMRLYLDGIERGSHGVSGMVKPCSGVLFSSPDECLHGLLDEVQIYNRALSPTEIQGIFDASSDGNCRPASFNYIEVRSDNSKEDGWRLSTDLVLDNAVSPTVTYSVDGGSSNPMRRVTMPYYQNTYLYDANVTDQLGGSPSDYVGSTFKWMVDDRSKLRATATVSSGIRKIPLSTGLTVLPLGPVHPTISWYNSDPNIDEYMVRIILGEGWVWQATIPYSSYGANPFYTIRDFKFKPGVEYVIRIEAREWLSFPFAEGSDIPTYPTRLRLQLLNRSIAFIPYTKPPEAIPWLPLLLDD